MISYVDSEVKIFHPLCEDALNQALKNLSLNSEYEVLHHQYTGTLEMDYVVRNRRTKKYLCVIEVKRTLLMCKVLVIRFKHNRMYR